MSRLDELLADSERIMRETLDVHLGGRELTGRVVLFSGGNDSTVLAHLARHVWPEDLRVTHYGHANTGIGVEATRRFVRDTAAAWGVPLLEHTGGQSYADMVLEGGFPGMARHALMYRQLKERALRKIRAELISKGRRQRVLFIAGRRRQESARRTIRAVPEYEQDRSYPSILWASPIVHWHDEDLAAYRQRFSPPLNPVSAALGMSGECLCGSFAEPGELDRIKAVDPDTYEQIVELERQVHGRFEAHRCHWGWHGWHDERPHRGPVAGGAAGPLCSSCDARGGPLAERLPPDAALDEIIARGRARRVANAERRAARRANPGMTDAELEIEGVLP